MPRVILLALLLPLLLGCGRVQNSRLVARPPATFEVTLELPERLRMAETAQLEVRVSDAGEPQRDARVAVLATMSHAGMAPLAPPVRAVAPGSYVTPLAWTMAGTWEVSATVTLADGRQQQVGPLLVEVSP